MVAFNFKFDLKAHLSKLDQSLKIFTLVILIFFIYFRPAPEHAKAIKVKFRIRVYLNWEEFECNLKLVVATHIQMYARRSRCWVRREVWPEVAFIIERQFKPIPYFGDLKFIIFKRSKLIEIDGPRRFSMTLDVSHYYLNIF